MPVDKVRPLKLEEPGSGTETDLFPTEVDPAEDYVATKGIAFESLDTFLAEKIGGVLGFSMPACSYSQNFLGSGEIDYCEVFESPTQTTAQRRVRVDMTYDVNLNPTIEEWKIYDPADGTTVLRTITLTHAWTGVNLNKTTEAIT